jgi:hypothetical protein
MTKNVSVPTTKSVELTRAWEWNGVERRDEGSTRQNQQLKMEEYVVTFLWRRGRRYDQ